MVQINFAHKEVNCKIVYYGPGMSGKTTNLEIVHDKAPEENKGELTSISTDGDRTLFFDFMPLDLGSIAGMRTKFQLYTVPGQIYYNSTRKLVLQGVDGVIFVADSDPEKLQENVESYENLIENLREYGKDIRELPHVIQYNKRDVPNAMPVEELDKAINRFGVPTFEAVARTGVGVFPALKVLAEMVLESINRADRARPQTGQAPPPPPPVPQKPAAAKGRPAGAAKLAGGGRPAAPPAQRPRAPAAARTAALTRGQPARPAAARAPAAAPRGRPPMPARAKAGQGRGPAARGRPAPPPPAAAGPASKKSAVATMVALLVLVAVAAAGVVYFLTAEI